MSNNGGGREPVSADYDGAWKLAVSLAVLADDSPTFRPDAFGYTRWGCEAWLRFPTVKLLDFDLAALEADPTIVAAIILMHRDAQETTGQPEVRMHRQLSTQVGPLAADMLASIERLSATDLEALVLALLRFTTPADLDAWLARVDGPDPA